MSKKKDNKKQISFIPVICALLAVVGAVLAVVLPLMVYTVTTNIIGTSTTTVEFAGFPALFGGTVEAASCTVAKLGDSTNISNDVIKYENAAFNATSGIAFILLFLSGVAGVILPIFGCNKLGKVIVGAVMIVAGVMFFTGLEGTYNAVVAGQEHITEFADIKDSLSLGVGAILAGVLGCVSGAGTILVTLMKD